LSTPIEQNSLSERAEDWLGMRIAKFEFPIPQFAFRIPHSNLLCSSLPMSAIAQSVSWWCFVPEKLTPKEFVRAAADAGYLAVDLVPTEYFSLVADHGLKIAAIAGHASLTVGLNRRDQHARIQKEIEAKLADVVRYAISNLICFAGNRDDLEDSAGIDVTAEGLALFSSAGGTRRSYPYFGAAQ
jgi:hypothetical protein